MQASLNNSSRNLREKSIDLVNQRVLITNYLDTEQEKDLTEPANCGGFGRIRHFKRMAAPGWPANPLPMDPASNKLARSRKDIVRAQVFQNACCNWRCWYCYVPFNLLSADVRRSAWMSAKSLLDLYVLEPNAPWIIDLSGGQPDLTPEWIPWMMRELRLRGLDKEIYLWSDDNLSNDFFWHYVSSGDLRLIRDYRNYGKVCCFKGFNASSFSFNTGAPAELFNQQFDLFRRYVSIGIDLYAYATFTAIDDVNVADEMKTFVDRLQEISPMLPLRLVPLEVKTFRPMLGRMKENHARSLRVQWVAVECWRAELKKRFDAPLIEMSIHAVSL
jgi:uncharacterized Fe-S cluster-containing radical SAM superfamily protein